MKTLIHFLKFWIVDLWFDKVVCQNCQLYWFWTLLESNSKVSVIGDLSVVICVIYLIYITSPIRWKKFSIGLNVWFRFGANYMLKFSGILLQHGSGTSKRFSFKNLLISIPDSYKLLCLSVTYFFLLVLLNFFSKRQLSSLIALQWSIQI